MAAKLANDGPECSPMEESQETYAGEWGREWTLPKHGFADDQLEDRGNPYVYQEKTRSATMGDYSLSVGVELTQPDKDALLAVLAEQWSILAFDGHLGDCSVMMQEIPTGSARPINIAPQGRSWPEREAVSSQLNDWLDQGVIRQSCSPWATRIVTVIKKDNSLRCCVDYRALNSVTD